MNKKVSENLSVACPMYKPVGRNTTGQDILKIYGSLRENMAEKLDELIVELLSQQTCGHQIRIKVI